MTLSQLRNVDFGSYRCNATGSSGVGYTVLDENGATVVSRTTSGVYQTAPGIYAAYVSFPDTFRGSIVWDTGTAFTRVGYASEQYNVEENDPRVAQIDTNVTFLRGITAGKWQIINNQMLFYAEDNSTLLASYDLFDDVDQPTMDAVFKRVKL